MNKTLRYTTALLFFFLCRNVIAAPVDLSSWSAEGGGKLGFAIG